MTAVAHAPMLGARLLRSAARGAILVGAAIVLGVVLLQVVHDSGTPSAGGGTPATASTTTTTSATTTTPTKTASVTVLNGSGVTGAATVRANALRGLGYAIKATTNAATTQSGTTVVCKLGDQAVADTIAKSIGPTVTASVSAALPPTAAGADCVVTVGK
jgi:hypothetical protein